MSGHDAAMAELLANLAEERAIMNDPDVAHVVVDHNRVLGLRAVPGLHVDIDELADGIAAHIDVDEGVILAKPVHICFGMLPKEGLQLIEMDVHIGRGAGLSVLSHCVFPNAVKVEHRMNGRIRIDEGASYTYRERHVHGDGGGVTVVPIAKVDLGPHARFTSEFELLKGRVGVLDMDYETTCAEHSMLEMTARINATGDDRITIRETGHLAAWATGILTSKIALRNRASADIYNTITASGPYARGHVDCKEIVQDQAQASATPIVRVFDARAHVTHEAAIGSVDSAQLQTLMARGLGEDDATDLIIQGLLG